MNDNKTPTGNEMMKRTRRMHDMVKVILINFPQTRGDHMWLWVTVLRKFYWKIVQVTTRPTLKLEWVRFDAFFLTPSFESCRRRAQEIQHEARESIWNLVAAQYPEVRMMEIAVFKELKKDEKDEYLKELTGYREREPCKKEFMKLARTSDLLPTERVIRKRMRAHDASTHEYGSGQMSLDDMWKRD